jgi:hypothetical protein
LPGGAAPIYFVLFERSGGVYRGRLQRDGTPVRYKFSDGTIVDDYLSLNRQAFQSLQSAAAF